MGGFRQTRGIALPELRARLAGLRDPAFRARLAQNLGEEARTQLADGFRGERDPYGVPWLPIRYRKGKILQKTGRMRAAAAVQQTTNGFRIDIPVKYAPYHQKGATLGRRVNAHGRRGRFISRAAAGATRGRSVRVSFSNGGILPRRQMLPEKDTGGLGPIWSAAFRDVSDDVIRKYLGGR